MPFFTFKVLWHFLLLHNYDEHGERFHQEISYMEQRYKGKGTPEFMLASYINDLIFDKSDIEYKRKTYVDRFCI